jgi:LDH2 family malate/lactate/ureidoglycolate dehydrogenase
LFEFLALAQTDSFKKMAHVSTLSLTHFVKALFVSLGASDEDAQITADSLISADLQGIPSHGVMLLPMYTERILSGSVSVTATPTIMEDHGGLVVMCADNGLGQVSSAHAARICIERAKLHGIACVTVRDAFHFGTAGYWARQFSEVGMIGMAFSNTRPLMPAPGGAQRVVGNNPLAIAFPSATHEPLFIDMATSATAMGKIRLADSKGSPIPLGWATDSDGKPTTSAADAINGMLLPAAGPKGFGLAVAIDLLCGALSSGGLGSSVQPLYNNSQTPYNCAHTFIAIDANKTGNGSGIGNIVDGFKNRIRDSKKSTECDRIYAPGDLERLHEERMGSTCQLPDNVIAQLTTLSKSRDLGLELEIISTR